MNDQLNRMLVCAETWQHKHSRSLEELIQKLREETHEYLTAKGEANKLSELGDIIGNALRMFVRLDLAQREFVVQVMEMKVSRRLGQGVKDKDFEDNFISELAFAMLGKEDQ